MRPGSGRRVSAIIALLLALLALGVVWRGTNGGSSVPPGRAVVGAPAPEFALETLDGDTVALSDLRGRPVWLNFWATWCAPCKAEIPAMVSVVGEPESAEVQLLAVNVGEGKESIGRYLDANGFRGLRTVLDEAGDVSTSYGVAGLPTHVFIDSEGRVRRVERRTLDAAEMRAVMRVLE